MTQASLDTFVREVLSKTAELSARADNCDAQEAYADEMRRWGWRG